MTFPYRLHPLSLIRHRLDAIEIRNPKVARLLCWLIPARCPFEQPIKLSHRISLQIPPLCHLNPFYEQLIRLRLKALQLLVREE